MFPGYLFAKFVYSKQHRAVEASHGIRGIVRFGDHLATLPENIVAGLQSRVGAEEVVTIDSSIKIGQAVQIIEGLPACSLRKNGFGFSSTFLGDPLKWRFRRPKCSPPKIAGASGLMASRLFRN
jgi:hypothetical protein